MGVTEATASDAANGDPIFRWESLWQSAQAFARACADNYSVQDAAFFYLHAGASVELGIKAALCKASPVLLIEGGNRFSDHALISLVDNRRRPPIPGKKTRGPFTVGFDAAVKRFTLLHGEDSLGVKQSEIDNLKDARDVTAHGGNVAEAEAESLLRILVTMARVFEQLAPLIGTTSEDFWGSSHGLVVQASEDHDNQTQHQVATLLRAANRRFQEQYGDLDPDALGMIKTHAADRLQLTATTGYRRCPVCGSAGVSQERPAKRTTVRGGRARTERGWTAVDFRCHVCKLYLPNEELISVATDFDPWESYSSDDFSLQFWIEDMEGGLDEEDITDLRGLGHDLGHAAELRDDE